MQGEETQFFNDWNYFKGLDWYLDLFQLPNEENYINFEKSVTYFHDEKVPKRLKALIKDPKLVAFLMNPVKRTFFCLLVKIN